MLEFFRKLFSSEFMPHGMCLFWDPAVLWLNVVSDCLIAAAYYAIPFLLLHFIRRRRDIEFKGIFAAFGVFILACGATHVLGAVTMWNPVYRLDGLVKAATAVASWATFLLLFPLMPMLISLPSPSQLSRVNKALAEEVEERRAAEEEVRRVNEELEERVARRTAEQLLLEEKLMQSQKMEAIGRLAGGVAHDFNNLLTIILGYTQMIREQVSGDQDALDYAAEVGSAAERASALTKQLLAFSRRQVAAPAVVDLNLLVSRMDRMLGRIIGEDVQLDIHLAPDLPSVMVDPSHVDQVIMNLAVNARDAMPNGGRLTIETAPVEFDAAGSGQIAGSSRYVMLAVTDTGAGMDADTKAHLFEPFFTTKETGKGTGLGLSIVYGVVKQNGGEILVYSEPGQGTVFKIYLPAITSEAKPLAVEAELPPAAATETILLVEDEDQVRRLTRTMLASKGYQVLQAANPAEAFQILGEHQGAIDLVLTDIVMPGMNGVELATRVRDVYPEVRVLFMSGYTDNKVLNQGILAEGAAFLQKPFTSGVLNRKVREVLNG